MTVKNAANVTVRTLLNNVAVTGSSFAPNVCWYTGATISWDGRNNANAVVPAGNYTVQFHAVDANTNTSDTSIQTAVDNRSPGSLSSPAAGATLSGNTSFVYTPTSGFPTPDYLAVTCLGAGTQQANGTWTGSNDTNNCPGGSTDLDINVQYRDQFEASHSVEVPGPAVTISNPVVISRPFYDYDVAFTPNGDGNEDDLTQYYCLSRPANVTITVYNAAFTAVRTLESNVAHGSSTCSAINSPDARRCGTAATTAATSSATATSSSPSTPSTLTAETTM